MRSFQRVLKAESLLNAFLCSV